MNMLPILKLNNIRDLHDARYCAAVGISLLGFDLSQATHTQTPEAVGEILAWLSGPQGVALFGDEPPSFINAAIATSQCKYASLPFGYPAFWAEDIECPVIFRTEDFGIEETVKMAELASRLQGALFEIPAQGMAIMAQDPALATLLGRVLLSTDNPDPIYMQMKKQGAQPWGFCLGGFVDENDGGIDYERCDAFLEEYFSVMA